MITVRATYDTGDAVTTRINSTYFEAVAYYVGKRFNLGDGCGGDRMATCTGLQFIDGEETAQEKGERLAYRCLLPGTEAETDAALSAWERHLNETKEG